jgi:hypothetical protein
LFDVKWSDHQINDIQWLRGDTFSWQDGSVYEAAYQHLVDDISGKSLQTETIAGTTISFYLADDGHKICPDTQESNVYKMDSAIVVSWYYILDTVNQRFKLPRTQYGFTGLRDTVEKYVEAGLPNITGTGDCGVRFDQGNPTFNGCFTNVRNGGIGSDEPNTTGKLYDFDASRSRSIYGNSNSVQPPATHMYLYFYVGSFTQTAIENTAGLNASLFNGKADVDLSNTALATADYVVEKQDPTALNNYTWYRKYKSGWVEQGGQIAQSGDNVAVTLPVEMANTNYSVVGGILDRSGAQGWRYTNRTTTGFTKNLVGSTDCGGSWIVSGIAA